MTRGVLHGSVPGTQLFTIYISDVDEEIKCDVLIFDSDANLSDTVGFEKDTESLQGNIKRLSECARLWLIKHKVEKLWKTAWKKIKKADFF